MISPEEARLKCLELVLEQRNVAVGTEEEADDIVKVAGKLATFVLGERKPESSGAAKRGADDPVKK